MKNRNLRYDRLLLPFPLLLWTLSGTLLFSAESGFIRPGRWTATGVAFSDFMPSEAFRDAIAPGALKLACAENLPSLVRTFREAELPFEGGLLRTVEGRPCHIWYEPTLKGFRADPDNWPIEELFFDVDTLSFLTLRESMVGDSLDILTGR